MKISTWYACPLIAKIPDNLSSRLKPQITGGVDEALVEHMRELLLPRLRIAKMLHTRRTRSKTPFEHRVCGLVDKNSNVFIGAERIEGSPPLSDTAEIAALGQFISSGRLRGIVAAYVLDACTRRISPFSPRAVAQLAHHTHKGSNNMRWIGLHEQYPKVLSATQNELLGNFPSWDARSAALSTQEEFVPLKQENPQEYRIHYRLSESFDVENPPEALLEQLLHHAEQILNNSTCIGVRPASKRHAVWFIRGRHAVLLVNSRDPEWHNQVRCAEMNAAGVACSLGWSHVDLVFVYSPDYQENGDRTKRLLPAPCPICRGIIRDLRDKKRGDVTLVTSNGLELADKKLWRVYPRLSDSPESAYADAEANCATGK